MHEIQVRKLYAEKCYGSLFEYAVQAFIQRKDEPVSKHEKKELIFSLQGMSKRECERVLISLDPAAALPKEKERVVSPTQIKPVLIRLRLLLRRLWCRAHNQQQAVFTLGPQQMDFYSHP